MEDYELPDIERIVEQVLGGLVKPGNIGPIRVETFDMYMTMLEDDPPGAYLEDFDFIQINRRLGYLNEDSYTDVAGLDVEVWSKTRGRASTLMKDVTKRLLRSEGNIYGYTDSDTGEYHEFDIDHVEILSGPDMNKVEMLEETMMSKSFELQVRVEWKD